MIGMTLIADGFGFHIERGYIYAAMFFSSLVETLNALARRKPRRARHDSRLSPPFRRRLFRRGRDARPGVAALVARVIGARARGRRAVHRRLCRRRHDLARRRRRPASPSLAKTFAGVFTAIKYAGAAYLLYLAWRTATAPAAAAKAPPPRLARASRLLRLAVADARQPEGDGVLPVDHAARGRREEPDARSRLVELDVRLRVRSSRRRLRALRARRQPGAGAFPLGESHALRPSRRRRA